MTKSKSEQALSKNWNDLMARHSTSLSGKPIVGARSTKRSDAHKPGPVIIIHPEK